MISKVVTTVLGIVLVAALFMLPKVVVDNDQEDLAKDADGQSASAELEESHSQEISEEAMNKIDALREKFELADNNEKSAIFADSLLTQFLGASKFDSAVVYAEHLARLKPEADTYLRAGDAYYQAHGFAMDVEKREELGQKARDYYSKILEVDENDLNVKNKVAMTYVSGSNPMQGIMMLREVLESDPKNEQALFNLGVLSIQSGQFEKAQERFEKLISIYPENVEAHYFLGYSHLQLGQTAKAKVEFELVKSLDADPAVMAAVDNYLNEIK